MDGWIDWWVARAGRGVALTSLPPTATEQDITVAYKLPTEAAAEDKAIKAFKPGYDVTTDPAYQVRRRDARMNSRAKCTHPKT